MRANRACVLACALPNSELSLQGSALKTAGGNCDYPTSLRRHQKCLLFLHNTTLSVSLALHPSCAASNELHREMAAHGVATRVVADIKELGDG